ncbi:MAG: oligosaccharide flippase family protein [Oscillospiraceae bacterium]|nr:oligosaccharide flippase family protein [Oscillospiraceae bacterium]
MNQLNQKTIHSAIWYTISSLIAKGITILLTPIYTRVLTKGEFGQYTNFFSWQNILVLFFSLCLDSTVLRARTDYRSDNEFNTYVYSVTIISLLFPLMTAGACLLFLYSKISMWLDINEGYLWTLYIVLSVYSLIPIYQAKERSEFKYKASSILTLGYGAANALVPIMLIYIFSEKNKLDMIIYANIINSVVWGAVIVGLIFKQQHTRIKKEYIEYALRIGIPVVPHALASMILGNSDKVMINTMCGSEYAAIYGVVYTCALAISLLRNSLNNAWVPWFYRKLSEDRFDEVKEVSKIFIDLFSMCFVLLCLTGPEIILILGGKAYQNAQVLIPIIMLGCYYNFLNLFFVNIEFYEKKTFIISVITVVVTILNILMNYIGILLWGYVAAAYTTAICNALIVIFHYFSTKKYNNSKIVNIEHIFCRMLEGVIIVVGCTYIYSYAVLRYILIVTIGLLLAYKCFRQYKRVRENE